MVLAEPASCAAFTAFFVLSYHLLFGSFFLLSQFWGPCLSNFSCDELVSDRVSAPAPALAVMGLEAATAQPGCG